MNYEQEEEFLTNDLSRKLLQVRPNKKIPMFRGTQPYINLLVKPRFFFRFSETLLSLSSWCLLIVVWLFIAVPWVCLQFVIVAFPDHTHLLFLEKYILCILKGEMPFKMHEIIYFF